MRHNKKNNHLGRTASHRKAMLSNMASSLIISKRINTTLAKAKALRTFVEPLITRSKVDNTHNRRVVFSCLQNKHAVSELFREVAVKISDRPGGYTRILKTGARSGDNAEMCFIELVDYNQSLLEAQKMDKKQTRRSRRGGKRKVDEKVVNEVLKDQSDLKNDISNDDKPQEEVKSESENIKPEKEIKTKDEDDEKNVATEVNDVNASVEVVEESKKENEIKTDEVESVENEKKISKNVESIDTEGVNDQELKEEEKGAESDEVEEDKP